MRICPHLLSTPQQAQAYIDGAQLCAPCALDAIESLLKNGVHINRVAGKVMLNRCGHRSHGNTCAECLNGVVGCGMMIHSYCKLQSDDKTANLLGRTIKKLRMIHWQTPDTGKQSQSESNAKTLPG